jgi:hypothetical protein
MQTIRTNKEQTAKGVPCVGMQGALCLLSLNSSAISFGGKLGRRTARAIDNSRQIRH